jgi:hypothetical protein
VKQFWHSVELPVSSSWSISGLGRAIRKEAICALPHDQAARWQQHVLGALDFFHYSVFSVFFTSYLQVARNFSAGSTARIEYESSIPSDANSSAQN